MACVKSLSPESSSSKKLQNKTDLFFKNTNYCIFIMLVDYTHSGKFLIFVRFNYNFTNRDVFMSEKKHWKKSDQNGFLYHEVLWSLDFLDQVGEYFLKG